MPPSSQAMYLDFLGLNDLTFESVSRIVLARVYMASILTVIGRKDKKYGETLKASINRLIFHIEVLITFQRVSVMSSIV